MQSHITTLHQTWMSPEDQDTQRSQDIDAQVTRRINSDPTHLRSTSPAHLDVQSTQMDATESEEDTNI